ncbi:MAG: hypothetical protein KF727_00360 [Microbacteriaceae bacterium]|nr:hypothetical protein [Microbacteriaceae bacterium]
MGNVQLFELTTDSVTAAHHAVQNDPKFGAYEKIAHDVYTRYGTNDDVALVTLKVAFVDSTNATNLRMSSAFSYVHWANGIARLDFDRRVQTFDQELVQAVAGIAGARHLSFASKYVTYHNFHAYGRDDYVVFDSVVRKFLPRYLSEYGIKRTQKELLEYLPYREAIDQLVSAARLDVPHPRRYLDHFIWWNHRGSTSSATGII